jgi:hypothetical protein
MPSNDPQIDFSAHAVLKKWPSKNNERNAPALWPTPYLLVDASLHECIQRFLEIPARQQHLHEIHTAPQGGLVTAVMQAALIVEIARLREYL